MYSSMASREEFFVRTIEISFDQFKNVIVIINKDNFVALLKKIYYISAIVKVTQHYCPQ